jgi:hypothetical protein
LFHNNSLWQPLSCNKPIDYEDRLSIPFAIVSLRL